MLAGQFLVRFNSAVKNKTKKQKQLNQSGKAKYVFKFQFQQKTNGIVKLTHVINLFLFKHTTNDFFFSSISLYPTATMPKLAHGGHDYFCCYLKDLKHTTPQLFSRNCLVFFVDFSSHSVIYQQQGLVSGTIRQIWLKSCITLVLSYREELILEQDCMSPESLLRRI